MEKTICIYLHIKLYPSTQNEITTVWCLNRISEVLLLNAEQQNIRENSSSQILLLLLTSSQKIRFYLHRELKQHIEPSLKVLKTFKDTFVKKRKRNLHRERAGRGRRERTQDSTRKSIMCKHNYTILI